MGLLVVPGAAVRAAQAGLQGDQLREPLPGKFVAAVERDAWRSGALLARVLRDFTRGSFLHARYDNLQGRWIRDKDAGLVKWLSLQ